MFKVVVLPRCSSSWLLPKVDEHSNDIVPSPNEEGRAASHGKGELAHVEDAYSEASDLKHPHKGRSTPILYSILT